MRQCPNCKTNNPDDARFCNYCGMRLPESKEETLYSDLDELEEAPKTEFSDQEIEEESEKVIDEAKKLLNPDEKEEKEVFLQEEKKEERKEDEDTDTEQEQLKKQLTIPENLDRMIEEVTRQELEQELHRKIKLKEGSGKEQSHLDETEGVSEPTLMIGEKTEEEADEPTRMFTGDIGDFIKKKREYEDVPEEDAYEEILQSWERKRKEKKIKREREGKDPSRIPKFIKEKHSWSDLTAKQKKAVKRIVAGAAVFAAFCIFESYHGRPEAVAERYCKAYVKEDWKKTGHLSDLPKNGYATQDEYTTYMKKNAVTGVEDYQIKETKENRQIKIESGGKQRAFTVEYKTETQGKNKETVVLQKQKRQRLLLFANWKVSSDKMIANDFNLYIPAGSTAWIDGTKLTKNDKIKDDSDGLDQYKISLFEGDHKIRIDVPWFKTYKSEFKASDKGSTTISKMKVSQSGKKKLDKKMELYMTGEDTELDRTVVDEIGDPLMHMLRNSADHGLEANDVRVAKGKPEVGSIFLDAYQDGNNVVIEVRDDGAGIDTEAVKAKAIERGTITAEQSESMTEKEIIDLLFLPSFSTSKKVTDISGRGVGLDVVKSKIESLSGEVEVKTKLGEGSTFIVRLPLTLAIIQALMVVIGNEKYAISLGSIQTIEDISPEDIKLVQAKEVIHIRGTVIPIIRMNKILDIESSNTDNNKNLTVIIVKKGDKQAGLVVDELIGQQEIVIKSMGKYIKVPKMISGATILGNGEVALILDANALI